ncbi:MAG TPA: MucB/RseB C-terminal domain-containing protein [Gammaproteobacteria bacterium]
MYAWPALKMVSNLMFGRQLVAAVCFFLIQPVIAADEQPGDGFELLDRMTRAMQTQAYTGTFIYRHKDKVETLKILHRNRDGHIDERLMTLSGKPREIIRSDSVVTCIWPESKLLMVDRGRSGSNFPGLIFEDLDRVVQNYDLQVSPQSERVAGRDCLIVDVQPKDKLRYGYRLWIDKDNHLLVRSDLLGESQQPLEQVIFTELTTHDNLPDEAFKPELLSAGFRQQEIDETGQQTDNQSAANNHWQVNRLPPGFVLQLYKQRVRKNSNVQVEHMVFSDGLASVSVFIEPVAKDKPAQTDRRRGALNVYSKVIDGRNATIVGEVPQQTVELIAESIQYAGNKK